MDLLDLRLIQELQRDGRTSLVRLGEVVGLRHTSVRERLLKLVRRGVLKVQANLSPRALGLSLALLELELEKESEEFRTLVKRPCVLLSLSVLGPYNKLLLIAYRRPEYLRNFIEKRVRRLPGLRNFNLRLCHLEKPEYVPLHFTDLPQNSPDLTCRTCVYESTVDACCNCILLGTVVRC